MKPGDFLLGVLDFFAILLPGSLMSWLLTQYLPAELVLPFGPGKSDPIVNATALLLSSYLFGHLVFMVSANLDSVYDSWRTRTKPTTRDKAFQAATELKNAVNQNLIEADFSTLKWAKIYVQLKAPNVRVEIDRFEADSKFFRSLVVVSTAFAAHFLLREQSPAMGVAVIVVGVLSFFRFVEQRWKMTELTYAAAVVAAAVVTKPDR